jgi:hypothetical protein
MVGIYQSQDNKKQIVDNGHGVVVLIILHMQMGELELKHSSYVVLDPVVLYVLKDGPNVLLQELWTD